MELKELKENMSNRYGCKICCIYCQHWGYNNHKVMTATFGSRCLERKELSYADEWCKKFVPVSNEKR